MGMVLTCPYCGVRAQFSENQTGGSGSDPKESFNYQVLRCTNCKNVVFRREMKGGIVEIFPCKVPDVDPSIPDTVAADYKEAVKCLDVGAYKACVVMCRRALQGSCIDKAASGSSLAEQVSNLYTKGAITKEIADWATEVRLTGNIGAHPDEDGLKDVSKKDAEDILSFLEEFLKYTYIMPTQVRKRRIQRGNQS